MRAKFLIPLTLLALWLLSGQKVLDVLNPENKDRRQLEAQIDEIRKLNPEADAFFAKVQDRRDAAALGATIRAAEVEHGKPSALRAVADEIARGGAPAYYRLMHLAADIRRAPSQAEREAILYSHGTTLQNLLVDQSGVAADEYLTQLEMAAADPELWAVVKDDPVGLLLFPHLQEDPRLWQFYREERGWLSDVLATAAPEAGSDVAGAAFLADLVRIAKDNHPQVKAAVAEFGLVALPLYETHGAILRETSRLGVPDGGVLEIIFANQDQFAENPPSAEQLINLNKNRPAVWDAARYEALVLRLDAAVPHLSEPLLEQFPGADIAAFLFTNYEGEIPAAASALAKFGDLGLYILNRYQGDPRVHELLRNPEVGARAIPFLARFGDQGFEKLEDNLAWLDRYFDAEGNPEKGHSWIEGVPIVGAPANVVQLWVKGHPVSWGELGWAGLDVVDGALLVASFGASAPVTVARQGAKTTARQTVKQSTRSAGRSAAAKAVGRGVARSTARESFLKKFARRGGRWAAPVAGGAEMVLRIGRTTASRIGTTARQAATKMKLHLVDQPGARPQVDLPRPARRRPVFHGHGTHHPETPGELASGRRRTGRARSPTASPKPIPTALAAALREWLGVRQLRHRHHRLHPRPRWCSLRISALFLFFRKKKRRLA